MQQLWLPYSGGSVYLYTREPSEYGSFLYFTEKFRSTQSFPATIHIYCIARDRRRGV